MSAAGGYALWSMLGERAIPKIRVAVPVRGLIGIASSLLVIAGMIYTPMAVYSRALVDGGHITTGAQPPLTLDSANTLAVGQDDFNVIDCLSKIVGSTPAIVAEGMINPMAYNNQYGRVSALSGIPTLIGWSNHEGQWRGATYNTIVGSRFDDEALLYNTPDWSQAQTVIKKYAITYVYVGPTEQSLYAAGGGLAKFAALTPVCKSGDVAVYATDTMPKPSVADSIPGSAPQG